MEKKNFIIDRFEGKWAVIEYGDTTFNFPKECVNGHEGDVLTFQVSVDEKETDRLKKEVEDLMKNLFK